MEYFRTYLWFKLHSHAPSEKDLTDEEWIENAKLYWNRFNKLECRLPKKVYQVFKNNTFHDVKLVSFGIKQTVKKFKKIVDLELILSEKERSWKITYSNVQSIQLKYMEQTLGQGFSDWGYDELLDFDEKYLSHEIIFASGALIYVVFPDKHIKVNKF